MLRSIRSAAPWLSLLCFFLLPSDLHADSVTVEIDGRTWTTLGDFTPYSSPDAVRGGKLRTHIPNFIPTLRDDGPNANLTTITDIYNRTHEPLLGIHPETLEWLPGIASHWHVENHDDHQVFWFMIDPRAKFSTGDSIDADDVLASFEHLVDPDIKAPMSTILYAENYDTPVVHSERVISVKTKKLNWRLMLYFAGSMKIYPADLIRIPGDVYLSDYNWKMIPGSGPYILHPEDVRQEESITLTRRDDWWANDDRTSKGLANFDKIQLIVVRDRELAWEKFKAGELDYYKVFRAQRWAEETDFDKMQKGWTQKRKIYNERPQSYSGYIFNMRTWPFDDKRVRMAFCYNYNRELLFESLFFNQYEFLDSYWPGGRWANPSNRKIRFNPRRAERLLDSAGYTERNDDGIRVHAGTGKALSFTLEYGSPASTRVHRVVAEEMKKIGIEMGLKQVDYNALMKRVSERRFVLHSQAWRGILFPNPLTSWHSDLASQPYNNNLGGFASPEVDALMEAYDRTFDRDQQVKIVNQIDGLIFKEHPVALGWYGPFERICYWNRFGTTDRYLIRITDERGLWNLWWTTPEMEQRLTDAIASDSSLPVGDEIVDPWGVKKRMMAGSEDGAE